MGITAIKCPNCGANVEYDMSKDYGFCEYCGTKVMQEKIVVEHVVDESGKYDNYLKLANQAFNSKNYEEAYDYYTKALEICQKDCMVTFRKAICAGNLSKSGERKNEVISGVKTAFSCAGDNDKAQMSDELFCFITGIEIKCPVEFVGQESVETYVQYILSYAKMADSLYEYVDTRDKEVVSDYCRHTVNICELLDSNFEYRKINENKKTNFNVDFSLSGISLRTNTSSDEKLVYNTPSYLMTEVARIRQRFIDESNKFLYSEIEKSKLLFTDTKKKVADLPLIQRLMHFSFSIPMLIVALVLAVFFPMFGLILLVAEIGCYIVYLKSDVFKQGREVYSGLRSINKECVYNKKQIKK